MTTRPFRLYDNEHWMSYKTLRAAVWDLCVKLYSHNNLELLRMGQFEETEFIGETFHKQYVIRLFMPYTILRIKKLTKGDLDQEEFMRTLDEVLEIFNERIKNKT